MIGNRKEEGRACFNCSITDYIEKAQHPAGIDRQEI